MEGLAGTFSWKNFEAHKERYEKSMTMELLSLIDGVFASKQRISEIVVNDAHGAGDNIHFDELPDRVSLIRGHPRPLGMMQGIDRRTDLAFFLGYHGGAGSIASVMDHTYASSSIYQITINGREVSEALINAGIAADFNVPVGLVSGDSMTIRQCRSFLDPNAEYVTTKESISRFATKTKSLVSVRNELRNKAQAVLRKVKILKPLRFGKPLKVRMDLTDTLRTDLVASVPLYKRVGGRTIAFASKNFVEFYGQLRVILMLAASAKDYL